MKAFRLWALPAVLALLALGCSDKQEEAAKLEQEMMQPEAGAVDTAGDTALALVDSAELAGDLDAGAIPQEEGQQFLPQEEETGAYVVQVAACESLEYAQYLVEKYATRGYSPYLTTTTVEGQTYYRVRLGGSATVAEARALKDELIDKYSVKAWIVVAE